MAKSKQRRLDVESLEDRRVLAPIPISELPVLESNPGASKIIHLDFDGHVVVGTPWNNSNGGLPIHAPPLDQDGDITTYNDDEQAAIYSIWDYVSEDFAPFDVNVTTVDPGSAFFATGGEGQRTLFGSKVDDSRLGGTGDTWYNGPGLVAGVAYIGSWDWTSDTPVWIFSDGTSAGRTASHEMGHGLGLSHDGVVGGAGYYGGHGTGETKWGTIMGSGLSLAQWSKGEYPNANNTQDDLAIITSRIPYRSDDHSDFASAATPLSVTGNDPVAGILLAGDGIISQGVDIDVFQFSLSNRQAVSITAEPHDYSPNLDIQLELFDASGNLVASGNDYLELAADVRAILDPGTYFVHVDGTGQQGPGNGDPWDGYSDYGSLGQFTIDGTITTVPLFDSFVRNDGLDMPNELNSVGLSFSKDVSASLDLTDLTVFNKTSGLEVDISATSLDPILGRWDLTSLQLPAGVYEFALAADSVSDVFGSPLDSDVVLEFLVAQDGDINLDGLVDGSDANILFANLFSKGTWHEGDINGDGLVDGQDFNLWNANKFTAVHPDAITPHVFDLVLNRGADRRDVVDYIQFDFSRDVSSSLNVTDLSIVNNDTGLVVDLSAAVVSTNLGEWDLTGVSFQPGVHVATLDAGGIFGTDGKALDGDFDGNPGGDFSFSFELSTAGDANQDGRIDGDDFVIWRSNSFRPGGWEEGDFDGDGFVSGDDYNIWDSNRISAPVTGLFGDFDANGVVDAVDVDILNRGVYLVESQSGSVETFFADILAPVYDIDGDGEALFADIETLLSAGFGTTYGDIDLDGVLSPNDRLFIIAGFGTVAPGDGVWANGDITGDRKVDASDLVTFDILCGCSSLITTSSGKDVDYESMFASYINDEKFDSKRINDANGQFGYELSEAKIDGSMDAELMIAKQSTDESIGDGGCSCGGVGCPACSPQANESSRAIDLAFVRISVEDRLALVNLDEDETEESASPSIIDQIFLELE